MKDFVRVAAAVPPCTPVGDFSGTTQEILALWRRAHEQGVAVVVFPELCLACYTARDLFFDATLLSAARDALLELAAASARLAPLALVGLPLATAHGVYNVAAALQGGRILALVPKTYLPTYREFEERRWFRPGTEVARGSTLDVGGFSRVPFGADVVLDASRDGCEGLCVALEVCEDMWVPIPSSARAAAGGGATVVCNLSASNFTVGKAETRRLLVRSASDREKCAFVYVAAGPGESSTDLAFDSDCFVCENGALVCEGRRFQRDAQLLATDVDIGALLHERRVSTTFGDCAAHEGALDPQAFRHVPFRASWAQGPPLGRTFAKHPFVPSDAATLATRAWETFEIQVNALATRVSAIARMSGRSPRLVLGVSGGLDSTQAALVCANALDMLGRPRRDLLCITMPGLGTTSLTRGNAAALAESIGAELRTISVSESSCVVLADMGHPVAAGSASAEEVVKRLREDPKLGDVSAENVQARMRTLLLMCVANREGGIVVGTGDLSEKALGWSTYSGDHISMYDVNAGVPKTLIQFVIRWVANERVATWGDKEGCDTERLRKTLFSILETPISPELLPPDASGAIAQLTEGKLGPYELHDFFLFHFARHGRTPPRILDLARAAFGAQYSLDDLKKHLRTFVARFFLNQFKRSCTADGPKVGTVALSPRGDWRMPSDATPAAWLAQIDAYAPSW